MPINVAGSKGKMIKLDRLRVEIAACLSVLISVLLSACGPQRPETVPVSGVVTFEGRQVPGEGRLFFTPVESAPGFPGRPGIAPFDEEGNFTTKTYVTGDGLMPGRYLIGAECWKVPPTMDGPPAESYLPPKYQSPQTSGWEVSIEPGAKPQVIELDIRWD
jgi:hypothetical protein